MQRRLSLVQSSRGQAKLGSLSEADNAIKEAWLRLSRSGTSGVETLRLYSDGIRRPYLDHPLHGNETHDERTNRNAGRADLRAHSAHHAGDGVRRGFGRAAI